MGGIGSRIFSIDNIKQLSCDGFARSLSLMPDARFLS